MGGRGEGKGRKDILPNLVNAPLPEEGGNGVGTDEKKLGNSLLGDIGDFPRRNEAEMENDRELIGFTHEKTVQRGKKKIKVTEGTCIGEIKP